MTNKYVHHVTKKPRPSIPMNDVKSTQVKQVGYDPLTKTLAVSFTRGSGAVYHYSNIEPDQFADFQKAKSIGAHFGQNFKNTPFDKYVPNEA